jgi:hypothetical protein
VWPFELQRASSTSSWMEEAERFVVAQASETNKFGLGTNVRVECIHQPYKSLVLHSERQVPEHGTLGLVCAQSSSCGRKPLKADQS